MESGDWSNARTNHRVSEEVYHRLLPNPCRVGEKSLINIHLGRKPGTRFFVCPSAKFLFILQESHWVWKPVQSASSNQSELLPASPSDHYSTVHIGALFILYWEYRFFFFFLLFYWSIADLQSCVSFLLYTKVTQLYIYIKILFHILFYYALCCAVLCLLQSWVMLCHPVNCSSPGSSAHGDSLGRNTRVGCHALQGIFPTQGSNPSLLHCRRILYSLRHQGSLNFCLPIC